MRPNGRHRGLIACAAILALAACGKDEPTGPAVDVTGTYTLSTISGFPLPVQITSDATQRTFIDAGSLVVRAEGTFTVTETDRVATATDTTTTTHSTSGTWTTSNDDITLSYTNPVRQVKGTYTASTLSLGAGGVTFVYGKTAGAQ